MLNRRRFEAEAKTLLSCTSVHSSVWIIALDIDHFKKINDTWGHSVGDEVLIKIGQILLTGTREGTLAARLGGEEFVIMVKIKNTQSINQLAFRLQKKIRNLRFHTNGESFQITASFGIARCGDRSLEEALKAADTTLYNSKNAGRGCISSLI